MSGLLLGIFLGCLTLAILLLLFLVVALVREVDELDRRLTLVGMAFPGKVGRTGVPVGSLAPTFEGSTLGGGRFASTDWMGREHLVLFAHPGCPPCETLVPEVIEDLGRGALPPTVIISEGSDEGHPPAWGEAAAAIDDLVVVLQARSAIGRRFETFVTPHLFVIETHGEVAAQGVASTGDEVRAILRRARNRKRMPVGVGWAPSEAK